MKTWGRRAAVASHAADCVAVEVPEGRCAVAESGTGGKPSAPYGRNTGTAGIFGDGSASTGCRMRTFPLRTGHMRRALPLICSLACVVCPKSGAQNLDTQSPSKPSSHIRINRTLESRFVVDRGDVHFDVHIEVIAQGLGPLVLILPSLGRSAGDYNIVA